MIILKLNMLRSHSEKIVIIKCRNQTPKEMNLRIVPTILIVICDRIMLDCIWGGVIRLKLFATMIVPIKNTV